ncbi:predicted protein [Histoplasma capsulatum var. duboisii H88]|uniref:Predicted protein n=1 Tax=Ajellomyces capsulatus (strain H88) TaxID=544711 RepID=F0U6G8_AJEC8|nr:predicted protein [Histoplasma capsulatum var. duboisii H88]QSS51296.1 hypothetical protein I7I53_06584 [Histoplasma capsulatum var. duboisii H88]
MFDARRRTRFSVEGVVENRPVHPRLIEGAKNVEIGPWCLMTTWLAQNREDTVHCTYVIARIDCVELGPRGIISQRVTALLMDFVNDMTIFSNVEPLSDSGSLRNSLKITRTYGILTQQNGETCRFRRSLPSSD